MRAAAAGTPRDELLGRRSAPVTVALLAPSRPGRRRRNDAHRAPLHHRRGERGLRRACCAEAAAPFLGSRWRKQARSCPASSASATRASTTPSPWSAASRPTSDPGRLQIYSEMVAPTTEPGRRGRTGLRLPELGQNGRQPARRQRAHLAQLQPGHGGRRGRGRIDHLPAPDLESSDTTQAATKPTSTPPATTRSSTSTRSSTRQPAAEHGRPDAALAGPRKSRDLPRIRLHHARSLLRRPRCDLRRRKLPGGVRGRQRLPRRMGAEDQGLAGLPGPRRAHGHLRRVRVRGGILLRRAVGPNTPNNGAPTPGDGGGRSAPCSSRPASSRGRPASTATTTFRRCAGWRTTWASPHLAEASGRSLVPLAPTSSATLNATPASRRAPAEVAVVVEAVGEAAAKRELRSRSRSPRPT